MGTHENEGFGITAPSPKQVLLIDAKRETTYLLIFLPGVDSILKRFLLQGRKFVSDGIRIIATPSCTTDQKLRSNDDQNGWDTSSFGGKGWA
jgi:hypothetical protein